MINNDEMAAALASASDMILAKMIAHEAAVHAGRPCLGNRASAIAFIAHCLGVQPDSDAWRYAGLLLEEYTANCSEACHPAREIKTERKP